ncbi:putative nucleic acid-binding Zn ribbon protein [Arcanobacterium pluranimalium]|uniref:DUF721 domain-containing protein n=1 Tax=Arcanobacterium pluranimalium TaxID=108028 RepID=UPI001EF834A0|nr:DciA family protein [Arcanobacterium pluranimalium]MBM7824438.1 putative nucleic acid-binding Zn ribbon protein [Arcanobacterium pluranimalium]
MTENSERKNSRMTPAVADKTADKSVDRGSDTNLAPSKIAVAKSAAAEKYGDKLPLQRLEAMRRLAYERGWVRVKMESSQGVDLFRQSDKKIGAEVFIPSPGQEVGSGARSSWRDPKPLSILLQATVKERGWGSQLDVASVAARWPQLVGETVAANCVVESFDHNGVLILRARTVSWETQMRALAATLDMRLAQELGEGVVKEIIINGPHVRSWKHGRLSVKGRGPRDTYD